MKRDGVVGRLWASRFLKRGVLMVALVFVVMQGAVFLPRTLHRTDASRDVLAYYLVQQRIDAGQPIYLESAVSGPHDSSLPLYLYPPLLASVLALFPNMGFLGFARWWTVLVYGAFWVYAFALARLATGKSSLKGTLVAGLALFFFPGVYRALELGQIDPLLWAFFGLALALPMCRGAGLTLIALIKPWGFWPLLFALSGRRRVWAGAAGVAAASLLLGFMVFGINGFVAVCRTWTVKILPTLAQGAWSLDNRSLSFALFRGVLGMVPAATVEHVVPGWGRHMLVACSVAGPLATGWITRRTGKQLQLAAVGCAAVLFSPICWTTYLPVFLTLPAILVRRALAEGGEPKAAGD